MKKTRLAALAFILMLPTLSAHASPALPTGSQIAAEKLLIVVNMRKTMDDMKAILVDAILKQAKLPPEAGGLLETFVAKQMAWDDLKGDVIKLYTDAFTEQELLDIISFYESPTGQKTILTMPFLMQEGAQLGQKRIEANLPQFMEDLQAVMKKHKAAQAAKN